MGRGSRERQRGRPAWRVRPRHGGGRARDDRDHHPGPNLRGRPRAVTPPSPASQPRRGGRGRRGRREPAAHRRRTTVGQIRFAASSPTPRTLWTDLFQREGRQYVRPKLVLFSGSTRSACGTADAAVGPFYCPGDQEVYLDTSFFKLMEEQFQSSGDFARAYVIAHEIGHHVQKLRGDSDRIDAARRRGRARPRSIACPSNWSFRLTSTQASGRTTSIRRSRARSRQAMSMGP